MAAKFNAKMSLTHAELPLLSLMHVLNVKALFVLSLLGHIGTYVVVINALILAAVATGLSGAVVI